MTRGLDVSLQLTIMSTPQGRVLLSTWKNEILQLVFPGGSGIRSFIYSFNTYIENSQNVPAILGSEGTVKLK